MKCLTFATDAEWIDASLAIFQSVCDTKDASAIALSGGSTPVPVYEALAKSNLPWERITFFEVDERYVPRDHVESNYRLISQSLSPSTSLPTWFFFNTSLTIPNALAQYEAAIKKSIPFDLCVLGLGPDGHTASLFPNSPALNETKNLVAHTTTDQFPIHDRLTLTFPVIMANKKLLLLLKGKAKEAVLNELLNGNKTIEEFPAKKLLEHPALTIHFCTQ